MTAPLERRMNRTAGHSILATKTCAAEIFLPVLCAALWLNKLFGTTYDELERVNI